MSQIGKKSIDIPNDISIDIKDNLFIASKGNNKLSCDIHPEIKVTISDSIIQVDRINDEKKSSDLIIGELIKKTIRGVVKEYSSKKPEVNSHIIRI